MNGTPPAAKLLAIDIDGTLLTPDKKITPRTQAMVRAARAAGVVVTLATARRYCNTADIASALGLDIPLIVYDGALILQHPGGAILYTDPLHTDTAQQAVEIMMRHHIQPVVHHVNEQGVEEIWTGPEEKDNAWITPYFAAFPEHLRRLPYERLCTGQPDPLRVVAFASQDAIYNHLRREVPELECSWNTIPRGNYGTAELAVMRPGCSKARGLHALAHSLGIPLSQVMAIGDNNNDIEMLEAVGWGVAMGQANEAVKGVARAVTTSNTQDGVALAIERYVLPFASSTDSNSLRRETCL